MTNETNTEIEKELILKELNCKRINLEDELRSIKEKIKEQSK